MHSIQKTKFVLKMEFEKIESKKKKVTKILIYPIGKKNYKISETILMF
jgi:hypothetical protein